MRRYWGRSLGIYHGPRLLATYNVSGELLKKECAGSGCSTFGCFFSCTSGFPNKEVRRLAKQSIKQIEETPSAEMSVTANLSARV